MVSLAGFFNGARNSISSFNVLVQRSDSVDLTINQWTSVADHNEGQYEHEGAYKFLNIFGSARFLNRFVEAN